MSVFSKFAVVVAATARNHREAEARLRGGKRSSGSNSVVDRPRGKVNKARPIRYNGTRRPEAGTDFMMGKAIEDMRREGFTPNDCTWKISWHDAEKNNDWQARFPKPDMVKAFDEKLANPDPTRLDMYPTGEIQCRGALPRGNTADYSAGLGFVCDEHKRATYNSAGKLVCDNGKVPKKETTLEFYLKTTDEEDEARWRRIPKKPAAGPAVGATDAAAGPAVDATGAPPAGGGQSAAARTGPGWFPPKKPAAGPAVGATDAAAAPAGGATGAPPAGEGERDDNAGKASVGNRDDKGSNSC